MKSTLWCAAIVSLTSLNSLVLALGERGVAERMLYWASYLAEEEIKKLDDTYKYTIMSGCVGSRAGGRCTLDELLVHAGIFDHDFIADALISIWAPNKDDGDTNRPKGMSVSSKIPDTLSGTNFNQYFARIDAARFDTGKEVSGFADSSKVLPGGGDFYDVLSKVADPIQKLSDVCDAEIKKGNGFKIGNFRMKIWNWGKDSAFLTQALRRKNMDSFRADFIEKQLGITPEFAQVDTAMTMDNPDKTAKKGNTKLPLTMKVIDFDATINKHIGDTPDIAAKLTDANNKYMAILKDGQLFNLNHNKAIQAAAVATARCSCNRPYPRNLRKRSVLAPRAGESKIDRSRRLKSFKLGLRGRTSIPLKG